MKETMINGVKIKGDFLSIGDISLVIGYTIRRIEELIENDIPFALPPLEKGTDGSLRCKIGSFKKWFSKQIIIEPGDSKGRKNLWLKVLAYGFPECLNQTDLCAVLGIQSAYIKEHPEGVPPFEMFGKRKFWSPVKVEAWLRENGLEKLSPNERKLKLKGQLTSREREKMIARGYREVRQQGSYKKVWVWVFAVNEKSDKG